MARARLLPLLALLACLPACGDEAGPAPVAERPGRPLTPATCRVTAVDLKALRVPTPLTGLYWGQEIWLSYRSKAHQGQGFRHSRSRNEALAKARDLCRQVHAGADIGALARRWSNAVGGLADGFCVVPHPTHRDAPDERDVTLFRTPVGELTPLIEWRGGFWFARRVDEAHGRALGKRLEQAARTRARARVIHIHHKGAAPRRFEFDNFPKEAAVAKAWQIIRAIRDGASFGAMAREHSNDRSTRERDGLLVTRHPITKEATEWIRWGDRNFNQPLLDVILRDGTPGELWPKPVVSSQGVDVVFVLERRTD